MRYIPKFVPPTPPETPKTPTPPTSIISDTLNIFLPQRRFEGQAEKIVVNKVGKKIQNSAFIDPTFESMLKSVGWKSSQSWCAYFVKVFLMQFYSFDKDYVNKNFTGGAISNLYTIAGKNKMGDNRYLAFFEGRPQVGDVVVWRYPNGGGHTGVVVYDYGDGNYDTIEGNTTASANSREGERVSKRKKNLKVGQKNFTATMIGFLRRNFTPTELENLYYDENEQTMKFKS